MTKLFSGAAFKGLFLIFGLCATHLASAQAIKIVDAPYVEPNQTATAAPVAPESNGFAEAIAAKQVHYIVTRADENFRLALTRWTKVAGWEFAPEHWAVPRDIPVNGAADFGPDFKAAVRGLLKASSLSDLPVQPCFYSNNVLRVIPVNELCARSTGTNINTPAN